EGATLARGELNMGTYGEGYVDRRHPHTYLHEAMIGSQIEFGRVGVSVASGKGFVPFGTDDPMSRPFAKYPVNHHLEQVIERLMVTGAVRVSRATLEGAVFNGDEPINPASAPRASRFADSWALRFTLYPVSSLQLSASAAHVNSPEVPLGFGLDQR